MHMYTLEVGVRDGAEGRDGQVETASSWEIQTPLLRSHAYYGPRTQCYQCLMHLCVCVLCV